LVCTQQTRLQFGKYNQFVFIVDSKLTKPKIRLLLEAIFSVQVLSINTQRKPKTRKKNAKKGSVAPPRNLKRVIATFRAI
jgi:ribosomal protein L23